MMKDPSLLSPEAQSTTSYPGGHNEGFPDTSKQMFKEVYAAIAANDFSNPTYPTFKDGLRELLLCERIIESNRKQAWVKV